MILKLVTGIGLALASLPLLAGVSLEDLMRDPEFAEVVISPTGEHLAATVPAGDQTGVVILDIRRPEAPEVTAHFRMERNVNAFGLLWASDDRLVFTTYRQFGSYAQLFLTGDIFAIDSDGGRLRQIYGQSLGPDWRLASVIHLLPQRPDHILVQERTGRRERPFAGVVNLTRNYQRRHTRSDDRSPMTEIEHSPLAWGALAADQSGAVRFAFGLDETLQQQMAWRPSADADWSQFASPFSGDIDFWGFTQSGEQVYVRSRDAGRLGVWRVNPADGSAEALLGDSVFAPARPIRDPADEQLIGAIFDTPIPEARFLDPGDPTARLWRSVQAALPGYFAEITSYTRDGRRAVVRARSDREPGIFLLLDTERMQLAELAATKRWLDPSALASRQAIQFTARDGLELHGFLTRPPGADQDQPLPLVVEVHGGPFGVRDQWFYDPWAQAMALRGFAVLQINFRGSGGRGLDFERDAWGQWGLAMQDDITDGTRWAIEQGIADAGRVCISGASYGGYAVLSGLTHEPDLYRCGFAFVGVYDLELMRRSGNIPSTERGRRYLAQAVGDNAEALRARSPIHAVDRIQAALFIAHGMEDRQAHFNQYRALTRALDRAGIAHERLAVRGEGHGFYQLDNRLELYGRALDFFDRHIGPNRPAP